MLLPTNFNTEIAKRFYDKEITVLETNTITEADGGIRKSTVEKCKFFGNIKFNTLGLVQNDIGQTIDADIIITCPRNTNIDMNDIVSYEDKLYIVASIAQSDSHLTITGKECKLKSPE